MHNNNSFDLIGDIHGQAPELEKLLDKLSYQKKDGVWAHATRKIIFLGDFIDRGKYQREVIDIVKPMVEKGYALSVMGNHEYNAIAYFTKDKQSNFIREHSDKNTYQHQAFLNAYENDVTDYKNTIEWFKTLPLWLDLDGLRVVHACWDINFINRIVNLQNTNLLSDDLLEQSGNKKSWCYEAIETLLKGKEIPLPDGQSFSDKDGFKRHHIRIRWWDQNAKTYSSIFMGPESAKSDIPDDEIKGDYLLKYGHSEKPVFLGHYWMEGETDLLAPNICCLDFSVAKSGGKLVAYRWDGERQLDKRKFISVDRLT